MSLLLTSWVCDFCTVPQRGSDPVPLASEFGPSPESRGYTTGFDALDAITGTGGYPIGAITEMFGDEATLERCLDRLFFLLRLDLDVQPEVTLSWVRHTVATCPMVGVQVVGGDGARYASLASASYDIVAQSSSGLVFFNPCTRANPRFSVAPRMLKATASLRIRVLGGIATVVKSRFGEAGAWCSLEP